MSESENFERRLLNGAHVIRAEQARAEQARLVSAIESQAQLNARAAEAVQKRADAQRTLDFLPKVAKAAQAVDVPIDLIETDTVPQIRYWILGEGGLTMLHSGDRSDDWGWRKEYGPTMKPPAGPSTYCWEGRILDDQGKLYECQIPEADETAVQQVGGIRSYFRKSGYFDLDHLVLMTADDLAQGDKLESVQAEIQTFLADHEELIFRLES